MSRYQVRLLDAQRTLVGVLNPTSWEYELKLNEATPWRVTLPESAETLQYAGISAYAQFLVNGQCRLTGRITGRDTTSETVDVLGYTEEIELERGLTPGQYGLVYSNMDLADVAKDLCYDHHVERVKDQTEWESAVSRSNVDTVVNPGMVMLAKVDDTYVADGHITLRFDKTLIPDFTQWQRVRWAADNDEVVQVTMAYRYADDLTALAAAAWSGEEAGVLPDQIGILVGASDERYLEVRFSLHTEDTLSDGVGYSPRLYAAEVVVKAKQLVDPIHVPLSLGVTVIGLSADGESNLAVLREACEQVGHEFRVIDGELHIASQLGEDRTADFVLRNGTNIEIENLGDDDRDMVNYLVAEGPGEGLNRLMVIRKDDASIAQYGRYKKTEQFPDATDRADLIAKADAFLAERKQPTQRFDVNAQFGLGKEPAFSLGDTVRVVDPISGLVTSTRVLTEFRSMATNGVQVELGLNIPKKPLIDQMLDQTNPDRHRKLPLNPPVGLRAEPGNPGITVTVNPYVNSRAAGVEVHASLNAGFTPTAATVLYRGQATRIPFTTALGNTRYYFVARSFDERGEHSAFTAEVSAVARAMTVAPGSIGMAEMATNLRPIRIVQSLPPLPDIDFQPGDAVALVNEASDGQLYRCYDTNDDGVADTWKKVVHAEDMAGEIVASQIAADAVTAAKIQAAAVGAEELAAESVFARHLKVLPATPSMNPETDLLLQFRGTMESTQGHEPVSTAGAELRSDGLFGGSVQVNTELLYLGEPTDYYTVVAWRQSKTWVDFPAGSTWNDLEAL